MNNESPLIRRDKWNVIRNRPVFMTTYEYDSWHAVSTEEKPEPKHDIPQQPARSLNDEK